MSESVCAVWDFRANEDYFSYEQLCETLPKIAKKWAFQLEQGDEGYNHWQGRISLIKKRTEHPLKTLWKKLFKDKLPNYLKPTSLANAKNDFYVLKEDTRIKGPWTNEDKEIKESQIYIPRQYRDKILYEWQQEIINSLDVFDERRINLIYDEIGNNGKSTVAAIGELKHKCIDMPPMNDFDKLMQVACNICMAKNEHQPKGMFFDLPRPLAKDKLYGLYTAIEQIKKGKLYDWRNHYKDWWIDSPVIWVFSNHLPDETLLSNDRWVIWELKNDKLIKYIPKEEKDEF